MKNHFKYLGALFRFTSKHAADLSRSKTSAGGHLFRAKMKPTMSLV
jgi:hypothetical protein